MPLSLKERGSPREGVPRGLWESGCEKRNNMKLNVYTEGLHTIQRNTSPIQFLDRGLDGDANFDGIITIVSCQGPGRKSF